MTALKPKLPADAQNRQCHHKVLPHFPGRRRQLKCTLSMHPTSTEGTQNSLTREGGCLGGLAHGPYDHYLGKITIKHCLAMGKSIGKVCSVTLYTEVHHIFAFLRVTSKSLPQTASDLHLPFFLCGESCPSPSAQDSGLWSPSRPPRKTEFIPSSALLLPLQGQRGSSEVHTAFKKQHQTGDTSRSDGSSLSREILRYVSSPLDVTKSYLPCHVPPSSL